MNLAREWVDALSSAGWTAIHWSSVGSTTASDEEILDAARSAGQIVMTQDLDFSVLLAQTHAQGPSVVQIRARNTRPSRIGKAVISALNAFESELQQGAIVVVDERLHRARVLPL